MGTTGRVIEGSDDEDFEDDVSNEYHASLPRSESKVDSQSPENEIFDTSGEQVNEAMHEACAGLFEDSPSVNITDQSGHIDLNITTMSTNAKRSHTTMEKASINSKTYGTKKSLFTRPSYSMHVAKNDDADQEPKKKRAKSAGALQPQVSERKQSQGKRSDETVSEMPSSHETHAAGSKQLLPQSPELFRTQTTVPFSNPAARAATQVATQQISPMVLIPLKEHPAPSNTSQPRSSAVMADIEDIEGFLREDIARGRTAEEQLELPFTAPQSLNEAEAEVQPSDAGLTVDPQSIMLDHRNEEFEPFYPKSSHESAYVEAHPRTPAKKDTKKSKRKSSEMQESTADEVDADLPPPEMYKPRPSKSRGRRTTVDVSTLRSPVKSQAEPQKKNLKRRKTAGDVQAPIEVLADDEEAVRLVKKARRQQSGSHQGSKPADVVAEAGEQTANDPQTGLDRASTVELGDEIEEPAPAPTKLAPKKKRGRPSKADKQKEKGESIVPEQEPEPVAVKTSTRRTPAPRKTIVLEDDSDDELAGHAHSHDSDESPSKPSLQPKNAGAEPKEPVVKPSIQRRSKKPTQIPDSDVEDELEAAHVPEAPVKEPVKAPAKRGRKPKAKKAVTAASDSEHEPDADNDFNQTETAPAPEAAPEPPEVPAKRGRKPKAKKSAEVIPVDEPEEPEAPASEPEAIPAVAEPEPQRSPLKEKPAAANQDLGSIMGEEEEQQQDPPLETPQKSGVAKGPGKSQSWASGRPGMHRVGLSRKSRIAPLLKVVKRE